MRRSSSLVLSLLYLAASPYLVSAGPFAARIEGDENSWENRIMRQIFGRQGSCSGELCGYYQQLCCPSGQHCYTDLASKAQCATVVPAATLGSNLVASQWSYSYSTFTTTNQVVVTITTSYYMGAPPVTSEFGVSTAGCYAGQIACGANCCNPSYQTCGVTPGVCVNIATSSPTSASAGAPLRKTSGSGAVATPTSFSTTDTFAPAIATNGATYTPVPIASTNSKSLSPGAIAGIVIGVIAGLILLLLICFCCILKAGFDGLLSLLGLRNRKRRVEETEVIEERYSRHSGSASRRDRHSGWFGGGGGRTTRVTEKRKSDIGKETGIMVGIAAALAGLWAVLGLRKKEKARKTAHSVVSSETYTSYTGSSESSASSDDRRTRGSRRDSRPPRSAR